MAPLRQSITLSAILSRFAFCKISYMAHEILIISHINVFLAKQRCVHDPLQYIDENNKIPSISFSLQLTDF